MCGRNVVWRCTGGSLPLHPANEPPEVDSRSNTVTWQRRDGEWLIRPPKFIDYAWIAPNSMSPSFIVFRHYCEGELNVNLGEKPATKDAVLMCKKVFVKPPKAADEMTDDQLDVFVDGLVRTFNDQQAAKQATQPKS